MFLRFLFFIIIISAVVAYFIAWLVPLVKRFYKENNKVYKKYHNKVK